MQLSRWAGFLFLLLTVVLPVAGADDKKDAKEPAKKSEPQETWVAVKQYEGTVSNVQTAQKAFSITVVVKEKNPDVEKRIQNLQMQLMRAPFNQRANVMNQMNQEKQRLMQDKKQEVNLVAHEDVKVRVKEPPVEFDEKGERKRYTKDELRKLAGTGNAWGYPADFEQLAKGDQIQAIVSQKKIPKGKKKSDELSDNQPVVTEIRIFPANMNQGPNKK